MVEKPTCAIATVPSSATAKRCPQHRHRIGSILAREQVVSVPILSTCLCFGQWIELARGGRDAAAADADRHIAAAVKRVDHIGEWSGQLMIFGDRDGQQFAFAATLQRVNHAQRQYIVHVVADVRVKDQRNWPGCGWESRENKMQNDAIRGGNQLVTS